MATTCAYCGGPGPLTREHLLPACIHERIADYKAQFHAPAPDKLVGGEQKIRDVCGSCNHGPLSKLDAYGCELYDAYFSNVVHRGQTVTFDYDFDRLARWLLKVAYNYARANDAHDAPRLAGCTGYILDGHPVSDQLVLLVQLVVPYTLSNEEQQAIQSLSPGVTEIPPLGTRIAKGRHADGIHRYGVARMLAFNSYHFYLLLPPTAPGEQSDAGAQWAAAVEYFQEETEGSQVLSRSDVTALLVASPVDASVIVPHFIEHWDKYIAKYG